MGPDVPVLVVGLSPSGARGARFVVLSDAARRLLGVAEKRCSFLLLCKNIFAHVQELAIDCGPNQKRF